MYIHIFPLLGKYLRMRGSSVKAINGWALFLTNRKFTYFLAISGFRKPRDVTFTNRKDSASFPSLASAWDSFDEGTKHCKYCALHLGLPLSLYLKRRTCSPEWQLHLKHSILSIDTTKTALSAWENLLKKANLLTLVFAKYLLEYDRKHSVQCKHYKTHCSNRKWTKLWP